MSGDDRNSARLVLLKAIYERHFTTGEKIQSIVPSSISSEVLMNYFYLYDKGLIDMERTGQLYSVRISADGMDFIEVGGKLR